MIEVTSSQSQQWCVLQLEVFDKFQTLAHHIDVQEKNVLSYQHILT
jgi:hypothetical protein